LSARLRSPESDQKRPDSYPENAGHRQTKRDATRDLKVIIFFGIFACCRAILLRFDLFGRGSEPE